MSHKHHDFPWKERDPEEVLGGPECLYLSGSVLGLVTDGINTGPVDGCSTKGRCPALHPHHLHHLLVLLKAQEMRDNLRDLMGGSLQRQRLHFCLPQIARHEMKGE